MALIIGDEVVDNLLGHLEENGDVWLGWTWWAGGPWWYGGPGQSPGQEPYIFLLDPDNLGQGNQTDKPAMAVLESHFQYEVPEMGDFNGDSAVNGDDLAIWQFGFGTSSGASFQDGDADRDGDVDGDDFLLWQKHFTGSGMSTDSTTVPEPTSWLLMSMMITGTVGICRFPALR